MKEERVLRSAGVVGSFTLLSRGLGMLREILIAYFFGTSLLASAFFVAFAIPNLFRRLFGEGALSAAFIPVFIETRTKEGDKAAWELAAKVVTMTAALLTAIAIIGVLLFSVTLRLPNLPEKWLTTLELARVMFPYVVLICMAALSMAVLNSFKHFATSAFAPCLLNLILIAIILFVFPLIGGNESTRILALAWGVVIAGAAQVAIQLPALKRFGCPFKFSNRWNDPKVRQILTLMGPAALGMAVVQFNVLIDKFLALWIGPWAAAALTYSERLIYLPLGVIATALSTVLLPSFSSHAAKGDHGAMSQTISDSLRYLVFIMIPASLGLLVLAPQIVSVTMEWGGKFDASSTILSARALMFYAPGLVVFSVAKVFVPAFYAMQDTKTPIRVGMIVVALNLVLNISFILILPLEWKHAGLALSTVISSTANVAALGIILSRKIDGIQWRGITGSFVRCLFFGIIMSVAAWSVAHYTRTPLNSMLSAKVASMINVALAIAAGGGTYFLLAAGLKAPELKEIIRAVRGKKS